jgi:phosphohistidine phosphatase SixA
LPAAAGAAAIVADVQLPSGHADAAFAPLLVLWPESATEPAPAATPLPPAAAAAITAAAQVGFVVVRPTWLPTAPAELATIWAELRRRHRIRHGAMHALALTDGTRAAAQVLACRHQFQSFTAVAPVADRELAALRRLPHRQITMWPAATPPDAAAWQAHFATLAAARGLPGVAGDVAQVLDDFHDAAANGDEARYFAILPDDAVFLGTDATERWTGATFRTFALPYFQRPEAWTYVTMRRHVTVAADGATAWFDELLDNQSYGECRGSGLLVRRDGRWVLQQYDLSVPVPNDLASAVAARIAAHHDGLPAPQTTVLVVRHAEKADATRDPELSPAGLARAAALAATLRDVPIAAVYHTEFRRTAATVAPLCAALGLVPQQLAAAAGPELAARLRRQHLGQTVLVCGHSNTVPQLLTALGVAAPPALAETDYDRLLVVVRNADGVQLVPLRYGP